RRRVAGGDDLQDVDPFAAGLARGTAELDRTVARQRVHRLAGVEVQLPQVAHAAGDRELHARRPQARPRVLAAVDRVAHHDVEARFRGRGREARREAAVEV